MTVSQILFVAGLPLVIGPRKTFYFFARKNKLRGSTSIPDCMATEGGC